MATIDTLRPYRRGSVPSVGDERTFIQDELRRIEQSIGTLIAVVRSLDERVTVLETP